MVWRMIKYFYLGDYPDSGPALEIGPEEYVSSMNINAELYALGDKYDIKGLKKLSSKKFEAALDRIRGGALEFCAAIPLVYTTTPDTDRTLRDLVFRAVSRNWKLLSAAPNFKDCMLRNPGFVIDVVNKMCQSPLLGPCKRCKSEDLWKVDHVKCSCGWGESVWRRHILGVNYILNKEVESSLGSGLEGGKQEGSVVWSTGLNQGGRATTCFYKECPHYIFLSVIVKRGM